VALLNACVPRLEAARALPHAAARPDRRIGGQPARRSRLYVDVLPVHVPAQVDHAQWVVRQSDETLLMLEQDRWAAPLPDEVRGAVIERLAARWSALDVRAVGLPAAAVWRVRIDVQRFESIPGREARLEAAWSLSLPASAAPPREASALCVAACWSSRRHGGIDALAAGHRRNVTSWPMRSGSGFSVRARALTARVSRARDTSTITRVRRRTRPPPGVVEGCRPPGPPAGFDATRAAGASTWLSCSVFYSAFSVSATAFPRQARHAARVARRPAKVATRPDHGPRARGRTGGPFP
jgi:uncharacterized lipoprotein YmbA